MYTATDLSLSCSSQFMSLLRDMHEKIVLVRCLFAALCTTKGIVRRMMKLFVCAVHGEIFEDHFTVKTFE